MSNRLMGVLATASTLVLLVVPPVCQAGTLRGTVVDAGTGQLLPCRVYIQSDDGTWYFPGVASPEGSVVPYRKQRRDSPQCVEMHSTVSAHPFVIELPPGGYTITVERGKEYLPLSRPVVIEAKPVSLEFPLRRWINMHQRAWYSGDTHVHRTLQELPNAMLAEDLNVAFPLLYWVTEAYRPPEGSSRSTRAALEAGPIYIDSTHVIYPLNTEYELFSVGGSRHTLGAFFVLNHRSVFQQGTPPVRPIAERAHREGGLLELDKHAWPWSMMLVPIMGVDLYELANNHVWRTQFGFPRFGEPAPELIGVERTEEGWTERGWIDYGFQNYYALLNCGFRLRPTAGTASGVHPVPLGFGRVYVHLPDGFSYKAWVRGLDEGRSFVTTGPMLFVQVNGQPPGHTFKQTAPVSRSYQVTGTAVAAWPLERIEIVAGGKVVRSVEPLNSRSDSGAYESPIDETLLIDSSSWIAVRLFEDRPDKRPRFAHSSPFHIDVADKPLRPRREEVEFLIRRVQDQIGRSTGVLPEAAMEEYREALRVYQRMAKTAR